MEVIMDLKRLFLLLIAVSLCLLNPEEGSAFAQDSSYDSCCNSWDCCGGWYGVVGAGYAFSMDAGIKNPDPNFWDFSNEGYDSDLGGSPFFFIGFGKTFCGSWSLDLTYSYYNTFHYQKYQTGSSGTEGFTGAARTRFFDLDHENVLLNLSYNPQWDCLSYRFCQVRVSPVVGLGIGVGINHVDNFHTFGYNQRVANGNPTSIGERNTKASFAWQALAALRFQLACRFDLDIGYRYYQGGWFEGPSQITLNTPDVLGGVTSAEPWEGKLKANEVYLNLIFRF